MQEPATSVFHTLWKDTISASARRWPALAGDMNTDVVIIGAGITGLSTAWHLLNAGLDVVVLEADRIGYGTTGSSTGNLYAPTGCRLHAIEKKHGQDVAREVAAARTSAVDFIEARIAENHIDCDFHRVPFHLFSAPDDKAAEDVQKEFAALRRAGMPVSNDLPGSFAFQATALTTLANQAQFNPLQYVIGLAEALAVKGCRFYENSRVVDSRDGEPCVVTTAGGTITARHVVKATHVPQGLYAIHAALIPHREYAVLARVDSEVPPPGIYWNANPAWRYSVRPWRSAEGNFVMVLGESHKPGEQTAEQLSRIERFLRSRFSSTEIAYRWAAQNYQPADLLPYIGTSPFEKHTWIATGFAADGLVWGTLAGTLVSDGIQEIDNEFAATFSPKRFTPVASAVNVMKENVAVSKHLLHDLLVYGRTKECEELTPGSGCVINREGEKLAACRDPDGQLHIVSAVCTHMGCLVHWNAEELSWDCPCHGSRFSMEGHVLEGPAQNDLAEPGLGS